MREVFFKIGYLTCNFFGFRENCSNEGSIITGMLVVLFLIGLIRRK